MTGQNESVKNELAAAGINGEIMEANASFCTWAPETVEEKMTLFNAINSTQESISDHVNEVITVHHIYAEKVGVVDENTGEVVEVPRIVLINENGIGYGCSSFGIFNSVKKMLFIFGQPSAENPFKIKIKQVKLKTKGNYKALVFELVQ